MEDLRRQDAQDDAKLLAALDGLKAPRRGDGVRPENREAKFGSWFLRDRLHPVLGTGDDLCGGELEVDALDLAVGRFDGASVIVIFRIVWGLAGGIAAADGAGVGHFALDGAQEAVGKFRDDRVGCRAGFGFGGPDAEDEPDECDWKPGQTRGFPDSEDGDDCEGKEANKQVRGSQVLVAGQDDSGQEKQGRVEERDQGCGCRGYPCLTGTSDWFESWIGRGHRKRREAYWLDRR